MKTIGLLLLAVPAALAGDTMPAAQQNELVAKYCASCHDDAKTMGGLTLQRFDAAQVDASLAAMMASKLKSGALGASGLRPLPDRATQDRLLNSLLAEGAAAGEWTVKTEGQVVTAAVMRQVSTDDPKQPDLYRLKLTCRTDTHEGEMQVAWAPGDVPQSGGILSTAVDGEAPVSHKVPYYEGNTKLALPLPERTLTVSKLFRDETVVFPFGRLTAEVRQALSGCFAATMAGK